jgi:hypothetical protein
MGILPGDQPVWYTPWKIRTIPQSDPSPSRYRILGGQPGGPGLTDKYGGGGSHDWYLILLALTTLYIVMRVFPKWGVGLGFLILAGAILSTEPAVKGFEGLVKSIQTGSIQL